MFDINTATIQEACDYAVQQIVNQGVQCTSARGSCMYSDGEGNHCAFGWLLPKDNDDINGSDASAYMIIEDHRDILPLVITENADIMDVLQDFHDADKSSTRDERAQRLNIYGINTEGVWWTTWIDFGTHDKEENY